MLNNIFKTALRVFWKERGYSLLNILGLTVGISASLLLFLYVQDEHAMDKFHADVDRMFLVMENQHYSTDIFTTEANPGPLKDAFKEELPEVEFMTQLTWDQDRLFIIGDESFKANGRLASEDFFHVFDLPFVEGSTENSLVAPDVLYLSKSLSERIFGTTEVVGQVLTVNGWGEYNVGGVFEDVPQNSSLQFEFIMPIAPWMVYNTWLEEWGNNGIRDVVKLHEGVDFEAFNAKIHDFILQKDEGSVVRLFLQNYGDQHLYSRYRDGKLAGGRITYVRLFSIVGAFILLIACINFMNLATARSSKRAKEVGVKKVVGSSRSYLIAQFMGESILMAMISAMLAGLVVMAVLPELNTFTDKAMTFSVLVPSNVLILLGLGLLVGIFAGSYPSFFLSSFAPVYILKGTFKSSGWSGGIRKGLVVFQFLISIFLIIGTLVIHEQITYVKNANLGYEKENVIYFTIEGDLAERKELFQSRMLENPLIKSVTSASNPPLNMASSTSGGFRWEGKDPESDLLFQIVQVGDDYVQTMGMEMKEGRAFDRQLASDTANVLINERTAALMGVEDPLNYPVTFWGRQGKVVGIIKDFHFASMHRPIEPLVISLRPENVSFFFVRFEGDPSEAMSYTKQIFNELNPRYPFQPDFLDDSYAELYRRETSAGTLANYFAGIAVFISLLGLFGLASFAAEQRIKEIGIRKVLGADVGNLILIQAKNFLFLVILGFVLAVPLGYFFMNDWLAAFEYRITIGPKAFLIAGVSALIIAMLTVSYHSFRAAKANPVKNLRYE